MKSQGMKNGLHHPEFHKSKTIAEGSLEGSKLQQFHVPHRHGDTVPHGILSHGRRKSTRRFEDVDPDSPRHALESQIQKTAHFKEEPTRARKSQRKITKAEGSARRISVHPQDPLLQGHTVSLPADALRNTMFPSSLYSHNAQRSGIQRYLAPLEQQGDAPLLNPPERGSKRHLPDVSSSSSSQGKPKILQIESDSENSVSIPDNSYEEIDSEEEELQDPKEEKKSGNLVDGMIMGTYRSNKRLEVTEREAFSKDIEKAFSKQIGKLMLPLHIKREIFGVSCPATEQPDFTLQYYEHPYEGTLIKIVK